MPKNRVKFVKKTGFHPPWLFYGLTLLLAFAVVALIQKAGAGLQISPLSPGASAPLPSQAAVPTDLLFHLLLALAAVMAAGRVLGRLFLRIGQAPVVGEVVAGILLGPSLLGRLEPGLGAWLLPTTMEATLGQVAALGVIYYMFQVGMELNLDDIKGRGDAVLSISHASIALPFVLGSLLALWLYPRFAVPGVNFLSFSLFMGVAMSITAFPVLARILTDSGLHKSPLGAMALSCAAIDDVTAWCLLAVASAVARARPGGLLWEGLELAAFVTAMVWGLRPFLLRFVRGARAPLGRGSIAVILIAVLLAAACAQGIGIHALFGAFLLGVLIPHDSVVAKEFEGKLKDVVAVLLLPAFFAFTGMRTQLGLLAGGGAWLATGLIVLAATSGKFLGAAGAARLSGLPVRDAGALGILMNTRGLVELIVLNVGLDLGVISPTVFTMMVVMALVTTLATAPALRLFVPGLLPKRQSVEF